MPTGLDVTSEKAGIWDAFPPIIESCGTAPLNMAEMSARPTIRDQRSRKGAIPFGSIASNERSIFWLIGSTTVIMH